MPGPRINWYRPLSSMVTMVALTLVSFIAHTANPLNSHDADVTLAPMPDWVVSQQIDVADFAELRSPSHYHLADKQINGNNGKQVYSRFVYSLTDPSGLESSANIHIRFNPAYETLTIHHIQVRRSNRQVNQLKRSDIEVINAEDRQNSNIYSGEVEAVVLLKDVRVGDVIDYSYTINGSNPVFADIFSAGVTVGWGVAVDKINVSVLMPANRPLSYRLFNTQGQISEQLRGNQRVYQLTLLNTPEVYEEDNLPSWYNPYPYLQFSEYQNWQQVAAWANELFQVDTRLSPELAEYVSQLKTRPLPEAIDEAINFSQNQIRYLGLELGENSHRPHSPAETYAHRQGDCKDKSLLLSVLLNQLGVAAYPALVSTVNRQHVSDYLPSHAAFNHAIVAVDYQEKRYWIDPTMTHQGTRLTSKFQANYGKALLVSPATTDLISAVPEMNHQSQIKVAEKIIAADYRSPVEWQIVTTMSGREADNLRYRVRSEGLGKLSKSYLNYYAKRYPDIESLTPLRVNDNRADNLIEISEHYLVADFWHLNAQQYAEFELQADFPRQYVQLPKSIKREQPLAIYPDIKVDHTITLQLPEHIDFSADTDESVFEDQHIWFKSQISSDHRQLTLYNAYQAKHEFVAVDNIAAHLTLLNNIAKRMTYYNSISNVTHDPGINEMHTLLNNLNKRRLERAQQAGE